MLATVAICTRNRAESLARTLESMTKLDIPEAVSWELVVVDNGSADRTGQVLADYAAFLPLRKIQEPIPGLSNARNTAVAAAQGEYIIWTDDDVLVEPGWFRAYIDAFGKHPNAAVFGGKILPVLDPPTPPWFAEAKDLLRYALAHRDFGDAELPLSIDEDRLPFGANYAVRTRDQRDAQYDPYLGVGASQSRLGEETKVIHFILSNGRSGWYVPKAKVHHCIPQSRQTVSYVFRYYQAHGETSAFVEGRGDSQFIFSVPRWLWRRTITRFLRYHRDRLTAPPRQWVQSLINYAYDWGAVQYWRKQARTAKR